ncbi:unnamed protein product [Amoebophrya sp. A25]|nr:unnamed protein product [Amoebophrya sp. A25]|eukprot:GSA25T00010317001.1
MRNKGTTGTKAQEGLNPIWKLQEFVGHHSAVTCCRLGSKSGQLLATGAEDKRVNVWQVGNPQPLVTLTGHASAPQCLVFDQAEESLVVGCAGGALQVWNLDQKKTHATFTGHRTSCECVEFHPYGDFFASGSLDTNMKIWDMRRKSCIQTYKGHTAGITCVRFSPHGRWVATAGQDATVKLWDLTAGKLMREFTLHKGAITSMDFHPDDFLLATASTDRTAKLWNLETFKAVGGTDIGSSAVQIVKFYPEKKSLLAAAADQLRAYQISNLQTSPEVFDTEWGSQLRDLQMTSQNKVLAISSDQSLVSVWVGSLKSKVSPARTAAEGTAAATSSEAKTASKTGGSGAASSGAKGVLSKAVSESGSSQASREQLPRLKAATDTGLRRGADGELLIPLTKNPNQPAGGGPTQVSASSGGATSSSSAAFSSSSSGGGGEHSGGGGGLVMHAGGGSSASSAFLTRKTSDIRPSAGNKRASSLTQPHHGGQELVQGSSSQQNMMNPRSTSSPTNNHCGSLTSSTLDEQVGGATSSSSPYTNDVNFEPHQQQSKRRSVSDDLADLVPPDVGRKRGGDSDLVPIPGTGDAESYYRSLGIDVTSPAKLEAMNAANRSNSGSQVMLNSAPPNRRPGSGRREDNENEGGSSSSTSPNKFHPTNPSSSTTGGQQPRSISSGRHSAPLLHINNSSITGSAGGGGGALSSSENQSNANYGRHSPGYNERDFFGESPPKINNLTPLQERGKRTSAPGRPPDSSSGKTSVSPPKLFSSDAKANEKISISDKIATREPAPLLSAPPVINVVEPPAAPDTLATKGNAPPPAPSTSGSASTSSNKTIAMPFADYLAKVKIPKRLLQDGGDDLFSTSTSARDEDSSTSCPLTTTSGGPEGDEQSIVETTTSSDVAVARTARHVIAGPGAAGRNSSTGGSCSDEPRASSSSSSSRGISSSGVTSAAPLGVPLEPSSLIISDGVRPNGRVSDANALERGDSPQPEPGAVRKTRMLFEPSSQGSSQQGHSAQATTSNMTNMMMSPPKRNQNASNMHTDAASNRESYTPEWQFVGDPEPRDGGPGLEDLLRKQENKDNAQKPKRKARGAVAGIIDQHRTSNHIFSTTGGGAGSAGNKPQTVVGQRPQTAEKELPGVSTTVMHDSRVSGAATTEDVSPPVGVTRNKNGANATPASSTLFPPSGGSSGSRPGSSGGRPGSSGGRRRNQPDDPVVVVRPSNAGAVLPVPGTTSNSRSSSSSALPAASLFTNNGGGTATGASSSSSTTTHQINTRGAGRSSSRDHSTAAASSSSGFSSTCDALGQQHHDIVLCYKRRLEQSSRVLSLWHNGRLPEVIDLLASSRGCDGATFCDFIRALLRNRHAKCLNLAACARLLPCARETLLDSKYEDFAKVGTAFVQAMLAHFGAVIVDTQRKSTQMGRERLDIAGEDRLEKVRECLREFSNIRGCKGVSSALRSTLDDFLLRAGGN